VQHAVNCAGNKVFCLYLFDIILFYHGHDLCKGLELFISFPSALTLVTDHLPIKIPAEAMMNINSQTNNILFLDIYISS